MKNIAEMAAVDLSALLSELVVFKGAAAGGQKITEDCVPKTILGRCLAATLRVYPTV